MTYETLSNGTIYKLVPQPNGSKLLVIVPDDRPMTEAEWTEYCGIVSKRNAENLAKMKAERIAKNRISYAARKSYEAQARRG